MARRKLTCDLDSKQRVIQVKLATRGKRRTVAFVTAKAVKGKRKGKMTRRYITAAHKKVCKSRHDAFGV